MLAVSLFAKKGWMAKLSINDLKKGFFCPDNSAG